MVSEPDKPFGKAEKALCLPERFIRLLKLLVQRSDFLCYQLQILTQTFDATLHVAQHAAACRCCSPPC